MVFVFGFVTLDASLREALGKQLLPPRAAMVNRKLSENDRKTSALRPPAFSCIANRINPPSTNARHDWVQRRPRGGLDGVASRTHALCRLVVDDRPLATDRVAHAHARGNHSFACRVAAGCGAPRPRSVLFRRPTRALFDFRARRHAGDLV